MNRSWGLCFSTNGMAVLYCNFCTLMPFFNRSIWGGEASSDFHPIPELQTAQLTGHMESGCQTYRLLPSWISTDFFPISVTFKARSFSAKRFRNSSNSVILFLSSLSSSDLSALSFCISLCKTKIYRKSTTVSLSNSTHVQYILYSIYTCPIQHNIFQHVQFNRICTWIGYVHILIGGDAHICMFMQMYACIC